MPRRRLAILLLACALIAATGLRVAAGVEKEGLTHDESISYLAAACHQGDYARITTVGLHPFGSWVAASEWKALLQPDRPLCFGEIGRDLALEDIHPPLYFWLLHVWGLVFGVGLWTGLSLNIVLAAVSGVALFGLARRVLGDPLKGALVAGVWSLSPAAIRVFGEARHYELLALLAILLVWQCVRFAHPPTRSPRRDALLLVALTAAGALAHFLFGLVIVAGAALIVWGMGRAKPRLLAGGLASIAAGYAIFSLLHPGFILSLERGRVQAVAPSAELLAGRVDATIETFAGFLLPPALARGAAAPLALALLVAGTAWVVARSFSRRGGGPSRSAAAMALVFAWLAVAHTVLFLTFMSPGSAMDFKHLSAVWPFAAFVPVVALSRLPLRPRVAVAVACAAALAAAGTTAALGAFPERPPDPALERAQGLVLDNVARGVLPRVVWRVPDHARVFAADQRYLLEHESDWLPGLDSGDVFVGGLPASDPRYGNTPALGRRVAAAIAARHRLVPVSGALEVGGVFRIGPPLAGGKEERRTAEGAAASDTM